MLSFAQASAGLADPDLLRFALQIHPVNLSVAWSDDNAAGGAFN
jgi:hypothetical protein